ncbi:hypothetical protein [Sulfurimonas sp.]|uniref:hypothetical protein n=1 Tax=Sulfurimonas sp. TaxID=2022749 RepID=UPI0035613D46
MKLYLQVFVFLALFFSGVVADEFRDITTISLKKDEQKKILVKYDSISKLFKFNWTLYKNEGLVVHRSYDRIVAQNILYLRRKNQSFRLELRPRGADFYAAPYVLVKFKEFKYETNEAVFELFLSDKSMEISLKDLKND